MLAAVAFAMGVGFTPAARADTLFTLAGHGYGHGIGMSQYGAYGFAQHGWAYTQILEHYFTGTTVAPVTAGVTERVLLNAGTVTQFGSAAALTAVDQGSGRKFALAAGGYRIQHGTTPGHLQLIDRATGDAVATGLLGPVNLIPGSQPLRLDEPAGIFAAGHSWRGWFRVIESGSQLDCVDEVPMEQYVAAVVPNEMPASWPAPALRAQAVATRSYAYATRQPGGLYDAFADTRSQVYGPVDREAATATAAAVATYHQVVWSGSAVATTFFSSSSGGRTSSEQAAWGTSQGQPYLVPVSDPYDGAGGANPNHSWLAGVFTPTTLAHAFGYTSPVASIDQAVDPDSLRERSLVLHTLAADRTWTGRAVQLRLGLRSNYFRVLQVTLSAPRGTVVAGSPIKVTGRVWPRPAGVVTLDKRTGTSTVWEVSVASVPLDAAGRFQLRLTPLLDKTYRLVTGSGAVSPWVHVSVVTK